MEYFKRTRINSWVNKFKMLIIFWYIYNFSTLICSISIKVQYIRKFTIWNHSSFINTLIIKRYSAWNFTFAINSSTNVGNNNTSSSYSKLFKISIVNYLFTNISTSITRSSCNGLSVYRRTINTTSKFPRIKLDPDHTSGISGFRRYCNGPFIVHNIGRKRHNTRYPRTIVVLGKKEVQYIIFCGIS